MEKKIVRTPIILADKSKIKSATPLEPLIDTDNNDIIIRNEDGISNTSIYESFKDKLHQEGYVSQKTMDNIKNRKIFFYSIECF